ncbi:MAG: hypothetical protein KDE09_21340, partial [Anaerolineales bacterium]|nr:hypothetical protein [Anaerolineales bacterium]
MNENKQQKLLQELDESWQALAAEKPAFDRAFAQQLIGMAADQEPEAAFRAEARAALLQAARQQAAAQRQREAQPAPKPTFWQEIASLLGMRNENMKRLAYLGGLAALFMVLVAVFWQFRPVTGIVDYDPVEPPAGSGELAELPQLPRLGAGVAPASGLGGGGNVTADAAAVPAPGLIEETSILRYYSVFSGTEFILAATLPADISAAEVYSQSGDLELTVEMAQALAAQMGFTGTLYTTPQPADVEVNYPMAYLAFQDGTRLTIDPYGSISFERIGLVEQPFNGFATEADVAVAEQFALERGLLPLPYEVAVTPWGEVGFYPVINGQRLDQMLGSARVIDGQVAFLYLQWRMDWQPIGAYPLVAPAAAWEQLLAQINEPNNEIPYEIRPAGFGQADPIGVAEPPVGVEPMQYWQREYLPGEQVTVYLYPSVLIALDGSAPIVETWPLALEADD